MKQVFNYSIGLAIGCVLLLVTCKNTCMNKSKVDLSDIQADTSKNGFYGANHKFILYSGRIDFSQPGKAVFAYPAVSIHFRFIGTEVSVCLKDLTPGGVEANGKPKKNFFNVYIDGYDPFVLELNSIDSIYNISGGLKDKVHSIRLVKRTEGLAGKVEFRGVQIPRGKPLIEPDLKPIHKMEFIGNSIICGYGIEADSAGEHFGCKTENASLSYGYLTAQTLNAEYVAVAYSGRGIAQNYDKSEVNTMPVLWNQVFPDENEPLWNHQNYIPEVVVINLGTNDFNCGAVDTGLFRQTYIKFLHTVRSKYPNTIIVCTLGPLLQDDSSLKALSTSRKLIQSAVHDLKNSDDKLYFFELSRQTGELGYGADYHPSIAQNRKNAAELIEFIKKITGWK